MLFAWQTNALARISTLHQAQENDHYNTVWLPTSLVIQAEKSCVCVSISVWTITFECGFSYSCAAIDQILTDRASRGPSAVAQRLVFWFRAAD